MATATDNLPENVQHTISEYNKVIDRLTLIVILVATVVTLPLSIIWIVLALRTGTMFKSFIGTTVVLTTIASLVIFGLSLLKLFALREGRHMYRKEYEDWNEDDVLKGVRCPALYTRQASGGCEMRYYDDLQSPQYVLASTQAQSTFNPGDDSSIDNTMAEITPWTDYLNRTNMWSTYPYSPPNLINVAPSGTG